MWESEEGRGSKWNTCFGIMDEGNCTAKLGTRHFPIPEGEAGTDNGLSGASNHLSDGPSSTGSLSPLTNLNTLDAR